jgi:ABC-type glycerol-3-phosphate transport system substrate-binding protein
MRYRVRALHLTTTQGKVVEAVGGWYDTREAAEAAARRFEQDYPEAKVEVVHEEGAVSPRLE